MAVRDEYEVRERVTDTSCKLRVRERVCGSARQVRGTGTSYRHELQVRVWVRVECRFPVSFFFFFGCYDFICESQTGICPCEVPTSAGEIPGAMVSSEDHSRHQMRGSYPR